MKYCRLCIAFSDLRLMELEILEVIQNDFSIEVNDENGLSKEICRGCEEFLLKYISFKSNVEKAQSVIRGLREGKNKKDNVEVVIENTSKKNDFSTRAPERKNLNAKEVVIIEEESKTKKFEQPTPKKRRLEVPPNDVINLIENNNFFEQTSEQKSSTSTIADNSNRTNTDNDSSEIMEDDIITKIVKSIDINNMPENIQEETVWNPDKPNCDVCNAKITDFREFKKHVNSKTHKFRKYVINKMNDSTIFNSYRVGYTCQGCKEVFSSKAVMCVHAKDLHKLHLNRNIIGPDTIILKKKEDKSKTTIEQDIKQEPGIDSQKAHKCRFCDKCFGFEESLNRHHEKHHKDIFLCMYCNHFSKNRKSFVIHLREHYDLQFNEEMCSSCFKIFDNHKKLTNHRKIEHETTVFVCNFCKEKFPNPTLLKKHKRDVHRAKNDEVEKQNVFKCKRCNRSFLSALVLEKHQCSALKFTCIKKCGKRYATYSQMERHSVKCTLGSTIYQCEFCSRYLKSLYNLKKHRLTCSKQSTSISARTSSTNNASSMPNSVKNICPNEASSETQPQSDHQSSPAKRKIKASSSKNLDQKNGFQCGKCLKDIFSIESFNRHLKRCRRFEVPSTREMKIKKSVKRLNSKLVKVRTPKTTSKRTINIESKVKAHSKISNTDSSSNGKACHICGIHFKNILYLNVHLFTFHKITRTSTPPPSLSEKHSSEESTLKLQSKDGNEIANSVIRIPSSTFLNSSARPPNLNSRCDDGSLSKEQRHEITLVKTSTPSPAKSSTPEQGNEIKDSNIRISSSTPLNLSGQAMHSNSWYESNTGQRRKILIQTSTPLPANNSRAEDRISDSFIRIPSNSRWDDRALPKTTQRPKITKTSPVLPAKNSRTEDRISDSFIRIPSSTPMNLSHSNSRYAEQRHYRSNTSEYSSRYSKDAPVSPVTNVTQGKATSTKLLEPEYIKTGNRSTSQLTIIPNSRGICNICRNPEPHLFCSPCARCFRLNQVQYLNHMKMKHSICK